MREDVRIAVELPDAALEEFTELADRRPESPRQYPI
jgi:hypothetical protein